MACPGVPNVADAEEYVTNIARSRSAVSSCRCSAASAFGARTASRRSGVIAPITPSSMTPAVCTTPVSGCASGIAAMTAARAARSDTSQATAVASAPRSRSSARSSEAPGASAPLRLVRTRWRTPYAFTRCRASRLPRAPVPPVTRTVPRGCGARGPGLSSAAERRAAARVRRGTKTLPARTATCGSSRAITSARASAEASVSSRSARTRRPGCSDCAERTSPQAAAAARSTSSPSTDTAPRETTASVADANRSSSSQERTRARSSWAAPCRSPSGMPTATTSGTGCPGSARASQSPGADSGSGAGRRSAAGAGVQLTANSESS